METLLQVLRAAGETTRLRLLAILSESELSVSEITHVLRQSQPRVSRHLKLLSDAGLITRFREGSWVFYRLETRGPFGQLAHTLMDFLPPDDPVVMRDRERLADVRAERSELAAEYFKRNAAEWGQVRALYVSEKDVEAAVTAMVGDEKVSVLVDLGTGTAQMLELLAGVADTAIGYDTNHDMLNIARANLEQKGLSHCHVRYGDILSMPEPAGSADIVIIHQVLHYLDDPRSAVHEAARLLKPGGRLLIVDFAPHEIEVLRERHAHRRLGFPRSEMADFVSAAGLEMAAVRDLAPGEDDAAQLTVSIWLAAKGAAGDALATPSRSGTKQSVKESA
jgi:DNA-binding transcriptional ArsR family regulator/precorrin-6B methylase 2